MKLKPFLALTISLTFALVCTGCSNTPNSPAKDTKNSAISSNTEEKRFNKRNISKT